MSLVEKPEDLGKPFLLDIKGEGPSKPGHFTFLLNHGDVSIEKAIVT